MTQVNKTSTRLQSSLMICALLFGSSLSASDTQSKSATNSLTRVYKVINADGSVSYSDQAKSNAEELLVPPVATVPAFKSETKLNINDTQLDKDAYQDLSIISPTNNSAYNSGSGNVSIIVQSTPALKSGDQYRYFLDSRELATQNSSELNIPNVNRGSHTVRVQIINSESKELISTSTSFTIHRPKARPSNAR